MVRAGWMRSKWVAIGAAALASMAMIGTALAASVVHIYPSTGYSTYYSYPSGSGMCYFQSYSWSHTIGVGIHGYYPQTQIQVRFVSQYGGWEDSPWDFLWGATWLVDGTNGNNSQAYIDPVGYSFTTWVLFYPWKDLNYQNPGYNPYVMPQWGINNSPTCMSQSYLIIHGPN